MKIVFLLERYLPEKNAGIENYTHGIAKLLQKNGHSVTILAMYGNDKVRYEYDNIDVIILNGELQYFRSLLQAEKYDICHIQEYSGENGINIDWFRTARQFCAKLYFTFHLPYLTCYKGDFRYLGLSDCNNFSDPQRCTKCVLVSKFPVERNAPVKFLRLGLDISYPLVKKIGPVKRITRRIEDNRHTLEELMATCDSIFIYADWFEKILLINGISQEYVKRIPYLEDIPGVVIKSQHTIQHTIIFAGRIEPQKGLHLLCKAMKDGKLKNINLDVYGNIVDKEYFDKCRKDHSFNYCGTLPLPDLLKKIPDYDFLVLPSAFTEMYSMMLRYAFLGKIPVIVSSAKGNKDVVIDRENGFLFNYGDASDLSAVLIKAYEALQNGWLPEFEKKESRDTELSELYVC